MPSPCKRSILAGGLVGMLIAGLTALPAAAAPPDTFHVTDHNLGMCLNYNSVSDDGEGNYSLEELRNRIWMLCDGSMMDKSHQDLYPTIDFAELPISELRDLRSLELDEVMAKSFEPVGRMGIHNLTINGKPQPAEAAGKPVAERYWAMPVANDFRKVFNNFILQTVRVTNTRATDETFRAEMTPSRLHDLQIINSDVDKLGGIGHTIRIADTPQYQKLRVVIEGSRITDGLKFHKDMSDAASAVWNDDTVGLDLGAVQTGANANYSEDYILDLGRKDGIAPVAFSTANLPDGSGGRPGEVRGEAFENFEDVADMPAGIDKAHWLDTSNWSADVSGFETKDLANGRYYFKTREGDLDIPGTNNHTAARASGIISFEVYRKAELGLPSFTLTADDEGKTTLARIAGDPGFGNGEVYFYNVRWRINGGEWTSKKIFYSDPLGPIAIGSTYGSHVEAEVSYETFLGAQSKVASKALDVAEKPQAPTFTIKELAPGEARIGDLAGVPGKGNGEIKQYSVTFAVQGGDPETVLVNPGDVVPISANPGDMITAMVSYTTTTGRMSPSTIDYLKLSEAVEPTPLGALTFGITTAKDGFTIGDFKATPGQGNGDVTQYNVRYRVNKGDWSAATVEPGSVLKVQGKPGDSIEVEATYSTSLDKISDAAFGKATIAKDSVTPPKPKPGDPDPKPKPKPDTDKGGKGNDSSDGKGGSTDGNLEKTGADSTIPFAVGGGLLLTAGVIAAAAGLVTRRKSGV